MSDSVRPRRRQPTRLRRPWDSPGKDTGVGCHFLLQCVKVKSESEVAQSCPTLSDPMDCNLPGSSVHGIFQAKELEWGAIAFSMALNIPCKFLSLALALLSHPPRFSCLEPLPPGCSPAPFPSSVQTGLLPTSEPLLRSFPGPGAPFPSPHWAVSPSSGAQDWSPLPAACPERPHPTPGSPPFLLSLHGQAPVTLWRLTPRHSANAPCPDRHTHAHQLREEAQGCRMMDEAAIAPLLAEAVVRSPLEEA